MATDLVNLQTTKSQLITTLADLTLNPKINYSLDGQSISWLDYQRFILEQIKVINYLIQVESGPFQLETQAWSE